MDQKVRLSTRMIRGMVAIGFSTGLFWIFTGVVIFTKDPNYKAYLGSCVILFIMLSYGLYQLNRVEKFLTKLENHLYEIQGE